MSLLKQRLDVSDFSIYSASYGGVQSTMMEFPSRDLGIGNVDHSDSFGRSFTWYTCPYLSPCSNLKNRQSYIYLTRKYYRSMVYRRS